MNKQVIDPQISRRKFLLELEKLSAMEAHNRKRGVILIKAEFPDIIVSFMANQLHPAPLIFTVRFNFDNYDLEPISVRFINLFTGEPINHQLSFLHKIDGTDQLQNYVQKEPTGLPFLCLPGVREYHDHPAHSGDSWLLHRNKGGEGTLGYLIDKLHQFGIRPLQQYTINAMVSSPMVQIAIDPNKLN